MTASLALALLLPVLGLYFFEFRRTIAVLTPEQLTVFLAQGQGKRNLTVVGALVVVLLILPGMTLRLVAGALAIIGVAVVAVRFRRKLAAAGLPPAFLTRLRRTDLLALLGLVLVLVAVLAG